MKPFSGRDENVLKQSCTIEGPDQTAGFSHASPHPQDYLWRVSQERASGHGKAGSNIMTEFVAAFLAFLSVSVFLAHAVDAYRAG
jgi:hypothetical protein